MARDSEPTRAPNEALAPPHNDEVEQALLGALIINQDAFRFADPLITRDDFYHEVHAVLWDAMAAAIEAGRKIDIKLLKAALGTVAAKDMGGGLNVGQYIARLAAEATTVMNAADYARTIRDLADRRRMLRIAEAVKEDQGSDIEALGADVIDAVDDLLVGRAKTGRTPRMNMAGVMAAAVDGIAKAYQHGGAPTGIVTGLTELDGLTLGLQRGDLTVLGGRPSMGKTALALGIARMAAERGTQVGFMSMEMQAPGLGQRMISDVLYDAIAIPYFRLRAGSFDERDFDRIVDAAKHVAELPITVEQRSSMSLGQVSATARHLHRAGKLDLLIVDYLQLMRGSERFGSNRVKELGEITSGFKALSVDLGIATLVLSQLGRTVDSRENKRPVLGDLRESGEIEQDADMVAFIYRESYYLANREPKAGTEEHLKWQDAMEAAHNMAEVIIGKQRMGPTGTARILCSIENNAVRDVERPAPGSTEPILL